MDRECPKCHTELEDEWIGSECYLTCGMCDYREPYRHPLTRNAFTASRRALTMASQMFCLCSDRGKRHRAYSAITAARTSMDKAEGKDATSHAAPHPRDAQAATIEDIEI